MKIKIPAGIFCLIFWGCGMIFGQIVAKKAVDPALVELGKSFTSSTVKVNNTTIHYVRGGSGPVLILIHGFPEDWYEFHKVMPRLAKKFTVVAVDLRGIGESQATASGYDAANLAADVKQLADKLKFDNYYVVGHDLGGMVTYALARRFPEKLSGAMIVEVPLPGLPPWNEVKASPMVWHINFHQIPGLPEKLVMWRQAEYFSYFFKFIKTGITQAEAAHYVNAYKSATQLHAGFEIYRAFPENERFNAAQNNSIALPIVLVGGEESFAEIMPRLAESLRATGCRNVKTETIKNARHYVFDEQPDALAELIEQYAAAK